MPINLCGTCYNEWKVSCPLSGRKPSYMHQCSAYDQYEADGRMLKELKKHEKIVREGVKIMDEHYRNYREGYTRKEKYDGKDMRAQICPKCNRRSLRHFTKNNTWHCHAKDCNYLMYDERPVRKVVLSNELDHLALMTGGKENMKAEENTTSEKIKRRIEEIIEKRKIFLKEVKTFIGKRDDLWGTSVSYLKHEFIKYVMEKEKKLKKQSKKEINKFLLLYNNCSFRHDSNVVYVYDYYAPEWITVRKSLELILKYGEGYIVSIYQNQLEALTKCQSDKYGINPCNCICEKCGAENQISGNFCSQCGEKMK